MKIPDVLPPDEVQPIRHGHRRNLQVIAMFVEEAHEVFLADSATERLVVDAYVQAYWQACFRPPPPQLPANVTAVYDLLRDQLKQFSDEDGDDA